MVGDSHRPFLVSLLPAGADVSGLLELPQSFHCLSVGGEAFGDAAVPVLVQLQQLHYLGLHGTPGFTDTGLQQLTDLDLGRLYVDGCGLTDALCEKNAAVDVTWDSEKVRATLLMSFTLQRKALWRALC
jgi:hypothetical protein